MKINVGCYLDAESFGKEDLDFAMLITEERPIIGQRIKLLERDEPSKSYRILDVEVAFQVDKRIGGEAYIYEDVEDAYSILVEPIEGKSNA